MLYKICAAVVFLLCYCDLYAIDISKAVGSIPFTSSVSPNGAYNIDILINVPKGPNGCEPILSLYYSSQSGYGFAGYGFSISGMSSITRGIKNIEFDGKSKGIEFSDDDAYYIDGKRFILKSGIEGQNDAVYTPEGDPFTEVKFRSSDNSGIWIEVLDQKGNISIYGKKENARLKVPINETERIYVWYIEQTEDINSNQIDYSYESYGLMRYPKEITYGKNRRMINNAINKIVFKYKSINSDESVFRVADIKGYISQVISEINTYYDDKLLNNYILTYNDDIDAHGKNITKLTHLELNSTSIDGVLESLNPLIFDWSPMPKWDGCAELLNIDVETLNTNYTIETGTERYLSGDIN